MVLCCVTNLVILLLLSVWQCRAVFCFLNNLNSLIFIKHHFLFLQKCIICLCFCQYWLVPPVRAISVLLTLMLLCLKLHSLKPLFGYHEQDKGVTRWLWHARLVLQYHSIALSLQSQLDPRDSILMMHRLKHLSFENLGS